MKDNKTSIIRNRFARAWAEWDPIWAMSEMKHLANKDFYYVPHSGDRRRAVGSSDVAVELVKQWIIDGAYSDKLQEEVDEANRYGASNTLLIPNHAYYKK